MQRNDNRVCYHCEADGPTREHVPPKCLFPKGADWSGLITVPSCAAHNNATSAADEYLKFLLGAVVPGVPDAITSSAARDAVRLALRGSRKIHRFGFAWVGKALDIGQTFTIDYGLLSMCLSRVARALYFHHTDHRQKLLCDLHVWPLFIPLKSHPDPSFVATVESIRALIARDFATFPKHGPHQEAFAYQIVKKYGVTIVNMKFYGKHWFSVAGETG